MLIVGTFPRTQYRLHLIIMRVTESTVGAIGQFYVSCNKTITNVLCLIFSNPLKVSKRNCTCLNLCQVLSQMISFISTQLAVTARSCIQFTKCFAGLRCGSTATNFKPILHYSSIDNRTIIGSPHCHKTNRKIWLNMAHTYPIGAHDTRLTKPI